MRMQPIKMFHIFVPKKLILGLKTAFIWFIFNIQGVNF